MNFKKKSIKLRKIAALMLCICILCCGCSSDTPSSALPTVPPEEDAYTPPIGDLKMEYQTLCSLYLPSIDGTQLAQVTVEIEHMQTGKEAETVLEALFSYKKSEDADCIPGYGSVKLAGGMPVSQSCGIVTVNLSSAALSLDETQLFTLFMCITNTLCALDTVEGVNILVNGTSPGLDIAGTIPVGCLTADVLDDPAMLLARYTAQRKQTEDSAFRMNAALYFPAQAGSGILCELRPLTFSGCDTAELVHTLLDALSFGAEDLPNVPDLPDLNGLLTEEIQVTEASGTGQRVVQLHFEAALNNALVSAGITRSVFVASLVSTLSAFLPGTSLCAITIGEEQITSLIPAGLYEGSGQTISFSGGNMRYSDFTGFLLTNVALYFVDESLNVTPTVRSIPSTWVCSPRKLFEQMLEGIKYYDTEKQISTILPEDVSSADLIGISQEGDTLLLNFSQRFLTECEKLSYEQESALIYTIVNTMTEIYSVKRVRFYVLSGQPASRSEGKSVCLQGDFMRRVQ